MFLSGSRGASWAHGVLPAFLLALLGSGCGERFELGEVAQDLEQGDGGELRLPLLADGSEDADAPVEGGLFGIGVGDVDGDGLDDWLARGKRLRYGRPRHPDGVLATPETEGLSFTLRGDAEAIGLSEMAGAGDVNGDGYDDMVVGTSAGLSHPFEPEHGEHTAELAESRTRTARGWAEQRAFLWYGGPERSAAEGVLDDVAVAFPTREDLPSRFESEMTDGPSGDEVEFGAAQGVDLKALGDIDGDGYDDLAWTVSFGWHARRQEQCAPDSVCSIETRERSESVTYIFYGSADALTPATAPAARLPGVSELRAVGDVNGDGFADMQAMATDAASLLAGSAERFAGELSIDEISVPLVDAQLVPMTTMGDLDEDGYDDLLVWWEYDGESARHYLFYGSPALLTAPLEKNAANAIFGVHGPTVTFAPVGDWDGDGANDILLIHARIVTDQFSRFAGNEVRLIRGSNERYSGEHHVSVFRPNAMIDGDNVWHAAIPGDIDGDGFADLFFGSFFAGTQEGADYVKYGSPLPTAPIY